MKKSNRRIASALLSMVVAATSLPMNVLGMPMVRLTQDESGGGRYPDGIRQNPCLRQYL